MGGLISILTGLVSYPTTLPCLASASLLSVCSLPFPHIILFLHALLLSRGKAKAPASRDQEVKKCKSGVDTSATCMLGAYSALNTSYLGMCRFP